jgi:hypothetical protein
MHRPIVAALLAFVLSFPLLGIAGRTTALDEEPCVTVGFHAAAGGKATNGHTQRVEVVAYLQDGRSLVAVFPYDWTYEDPARDNPFYGANVFRYRTPFAVQLPKERLEKQSLPPIIAYVLEHTDAGGHLHTKSCPPSTPPPATTLHEGINAGTLIRHVRNTTHEPLYLTSEIRSKADGPITVCLLALNIGKHPIDHLDLRFDFNLSSGIVIATPYEWRVSLEPTTAERNQWYDIILSMSSAGQDACVPITDDPRLKPNLDAIREIDITIVGMHTSG